MPQAAIDATTAPCPKCRTDMVLAVIMPHPVAHQLARHTYLCAPCNRTKTYILPIGPSPDSEAPRDAPANVIRRAAGTRGPSPRPTETLATPASIYGKDGFPLPCTCAIFQDPEAAWSCSSSWRCRNISCFLLLPDGSGRRVQQGVADCPDRGVRLSRKRTGSDAAPAQSRRRIYQ